MKPEEEKRRERERRPGEGEGGGDVDEKQENGRRAEDFRGGSKNTENAPLFSGSTLICARARAHAGAHEETWSARGAWRERDGESERKAVVARDPESARETAGADRVYARYDWLDESIVDPLSRRGRGRGNCSYFTDLYHERRIAQESTARDDASPADESGAPRRAAPSRNRIKRFLEVSEV